MLLKKVNKTKSKEEEISDELESESDEEPVKKRKKSAEIKGKKVQRGKREFRRRAWNNEEKDTMNRQMAVYWLRKKVPNKKECDECLSREPDLNRRSWTDVKNYVCNVIKKCERVLIKDKEQCCGGNNKCILIFFIIILLYGEFHELKNKKKLSHHTHN